MVGLHGLYIAGYASIRHKDVERKNDCGTCACSLIIRLSSGHITHNAPASFTPIRSLQLIQPNHSTGDVTSITRHWIRGYDASVYDLGQDLENTAAQCVLITRTDRKSWVKLGAAKGGVYTYLGALRQGLTQERVEADAEMQLAFMGPYDLLSNNCYTFVRRMYAVEKLL